MSDLDRSHAATPQRRARALAEGHVPRSHDLSTAVVLITGAAMLLYTGRNIAQSLAAVTREQLGGEAWLAADQGEILARLRGLAWGVGEALLPLFAVMFVAAVAVELAQTGLMLRPERLTPDLNRINPGTHLARIFSWSTLGRVVSGLVKVLVILLVGWLVLRHELPRLLAAGGMTPPQLANWLGEVLPWMLAKVAGALVLWGAIDYALAWWRHERSLAMTSQELREEMREMGGSRKAVARRKPLQTERTTEAVSSIGAS